jgi:hypothetical protein
MKDKEVRLIYKPCKQLFYLYKDDEFLRDIVRPDIATHLFLLECLNADHES